ncbi:MAG: 50S ribosomal protein L9 [Acidaminococcaceae bacterium]|nr:50S ribosomal protein L9 [Acidaminococcaceae bacterium]MDD4721436.1 50S ribosomal protein L9 [Acidaminococcaceae bacterium]
MKVILLQDVKKLGKKGDIVETAEGYGRNYLLPRALAKEASAANLNLARQSQEVAAHRAAQKRDEAIVLAAQLEKVVVKMSVKVGANGKMFGSIASKDVAEALIEQTQLEGVDRRKIELTSPIKSAGRYTAVAKLHPEISATFVVEVEEA